MSQKYHTQQSSSLYKTVRPVLPTDSQALEQMYRQSRFEAQCWFFTSLIVAIAGTVFVLGTILLFFIFNDTVMVNSDGKLILAIANVVIGVTQHLIIAQTRTANKRADYYARALNHEANELHLTEILQIILSSLPEGEERNALLIQAIMDALIHRPHVEQSSIPTPSTPNSKEKQKHHHKL
jgi:hypothetical protein